MTLKTQPYYTAIVYGLYMYLLYQAIAFLRFREFIGSCPECNFGTMDEISFLLFNHGSPYIIGVLSVLLLYYFAKKYNVEPKKLLRNFIIAIPFSFVFSLMGGLLGYSGLLVFGVLPFIITLSLVKKHPSKPDNQPK